MCVCFLRSDLIEQYRILKQECSLLWVVCKIAIVTPEIAQKSPTNCGNDREKKTVAICKILGRKNMKNKIAASPRFEIGAFSGR